jgi:cellulose synthase/poly-beta-1,6-N-acetylglucosamine synthase-like glycosyltransferase
LQKCLDSLAEQDCTGYEILLVLNREGEAPPLQVPDHVPYRFLRELRPGVCVARNSAIPEARGDILAFVDDDIVAHEGWLHRLLEGFADPQVACVTGRVIPEGPGYLTAAETEHFYFGQHARHARTFDSSNGWYRDLLAGRVFGLGCNMAFRKDFLQGPSPFPESLGAGAPIAAADETYMFLQVLKRGFRLRYSTDAVVTQYFPADPHERKMRVQEGKEGNVAFALRLLIEEEGRRLATLGHFLSRARRFLGAGRREGPEKTFPELLSRGEKVRAYLRGAWLYCKVRKVAPTHNRKISN